MKNKKRNILVRIGTGLMALALTMLALMVLTAGCGVRADNRTAYEKIQEKLISMETYEAEADITYISNKNSHTYETKQQCRMSGEYRIEVTAPERVAGNVTVCDGKTIAQFNERVAGKISVSANEAMERIELFLTSFIKNYVRSQEVSIAVANIDNEPCTVLEASIPGEHPYLRSEKLWVDNTTLKPVRLIIYDSNGSERIVVTYKSFEYNINLKDELFTIE